MATSSMHKPGWRSRRRSRLSLVERAVPQLGRALESDQSGKAASADKQPPAEASPATHAFQGMPKAKAETATVSDGGVPAVNGNSAVADRKEHATDIADAMLETEGGLPDTPPDEANAEPSTENDVPPLQADENHPAEAKGDAPAAPADVAAASVSEPVSLAANVRDEIDDPSAAMPASPQRPPLDLDWDRLVESGFLDPRDRLRPLSKTMDEIVRALIRQALSDQSSWRDRVILVTSPNEHRSKTAASINFAFGLTTVANHHVVLVDVDADGLGAVGRLGGGERIGITEALADESIAVSDLPIKTDLERLTLVASGRHQEEALDRFASRRMLEILRYLTRNPETILIIDAPPVLQSQEAAVLSVVAGQVAMSVEAGRTTADQIEHALQRIGERHNVSLVLNESSGVAGDEEPPAAADTGKPALTSRRMPESRRRLSRAAAAATGAAMLGLIGLPPTLQATSTPTATPPERWSAEIIQSKPSCRQDYR